MNKLNELRNLINEVQEKPVYLGLLNQYGEEINFPEYKREIINFNINITNTNMTLTNEDTICFQEANSDWGNISGFGIYKTETGESLLQVSYLEYMRSVYAYTTLIAPEKLLSFNIPLFEDYITVNNNPLLKYLFSENNNNKAIIKKIVIKRLWNVSFISIIK